MTMLRWLLVGATACVVTASGAAIAATQVVGSGVAKDCYRAAKFDTSPRQGVRFCDLALDSEPLNIRDRAATLNNRGILLLRLKATDKALEDFDRAVTLKPELSNVYINRSAAYVRLKRHREAIADATHAIELNADETHAALFNRAMAYEQLGDLTAAYHDLKAALAAKPDFVEAQTELDRYQVVQQ